MIKRFLCCCDLVNHLTFVVGIINIILHFLLAMAVDSGTSTEKLVFMCVRGFFNICHAAIQLSLQAPLVSSNYSIDPVSQSSAIRCISVVNDDVYVWSVKSNGLPHITVWVATMTRRLSNLQFSSFLIGLNICGLTAVLVCQNFMISVMLKSSMLDYPL